MEALAFCKPIASAARVKLASSATRTKMRMDSSRLIKLRTDCSAGLNTMVPWRSFIQNPPVPILVSPNQERRSHEQQSAYRSDYRRKPWSWAQFGHQARGSGYRCREHLSKQPRGGGQRRCGDPRAGSARRGAPSGCLAGDRVRFFRSSVARDIVGALEPRPLRLPSEQCRNGRARFRYGDHGSAVRRAREHSSERHVFSDAEAPAADCGWWADTQCIERPRALYAAWLL